MPECLPIRFDSGPKHHLAAFTGDPPPVGTRVVVATRKGPRLARVRGRPRPGKPEVELLRTATAEDLERWRRLLERAARAKWRIRAFLRQRKPRVSLVGLEYTLDGRVAFVYYQSERRERFAAEIRDLARLAEARAELVYLGARDAVAVLGAIGPCGRETCCSTWMQEFGSSTIRMARDQELPLSPEKINGPCGRLLCCIAYEHPLYREILDRMPKKNARVCTKTGVCGKVVKHYPLKFEVEIKTPAGGLVTARADEVTPWTEES